VLNASNNEVKWLAIGGCINYWAGKRCLPDSPRAPDSQGDRVRRLITFNQGQMIDPLPLPSIISTRYHSSCLAWSSLMVVEGEVLPCYQMWQRMCRQEGFVVFCSGFSLCVIGQADHTISLMRTLKKNACSRGSHSLPYFVTSCFQYHSGTSIVNCVTRFLLTWLRTAWLEIPASIPRGRSDFSLRQSAVSGTHRDPYALGTRCSTIGGKATGACR